MKKKENLVKKHIVQIIILAVIAVLINCILLLAYLNEKSQIMNHLYYDVTVNADGSMTVAETWDININHTNTIFKNFDKSSKYGEIKDVTVKDLETGLYLTKINQEMYHVTDNCYYALDIQGNKFEIAWGTGMEEKTGKKKYLITYTVTDVITDYTDCQELYWQFLSDSNAIPVKKITGKIHIPYGTNDVKNLKVWGHGPLNGNIEIKNKNLVEFDIDGLNSERMLEVRVVTTNRIIENISIDKVKLYPYLQNIIDEETKWANEANEQSEAFNKYKMIGLAIYAIILLIVVIKILKYKKLLQQKDDGIEHLNLEYYRDIPREDESTPAEATYLYYFDKRIKQAFRQSDTVAATILDLALKKYISLECNGKDVFVKILKDSDGLKEDEKQVYTLLKNAGATEDGFEIKDLNAYAKKQYYQYSTYITRLESYSKTSVHKLGYIDKGQQKAYEKSLRAKDSFNSLLGSTELALLVLIIANFPIFSNAVVFGVGPNFIKSIIKFAIVLLPYIVLKLVQLKTLSKIQPKLAILTQKGSEEKEKWQALAKFLENYSLIKDKDVPSLEIWEKYLVFATAFGIADKVIEQMKASYPEVFVREFWEDEEHTNSYPIIRLASYNFNNYSGTNNFSPINSIGKTASSAYGITRREIASHTSSSGSGGGGGFSGGGGGRRRRWPEWEADNK